MNHPEISSAENTGYPTRLQSSSTEPRCPACFEICEKLYKDRSSGEIYGCENCIEEVDPWEEQEEED